MTKGKNILIYSVLFIVGGYYLFFGLTKAQGILVPIAYALILSIVVLPLSNWMEKKGMKRIFSSLTNTVFLLLLALGFFAIISFQVKSFIDDWSQIKQTMEPKIEQLRIFILEHTPIDQEDLENTEDGKGLLGSGGSETAIQILNRTFSFFGNFLLTFIYIFFLLNYRKRFRDFILHLFPEQKRREADSVVNESARVVQQYLVGKLLLIGILAVLYSIGLGISGVKNFILVSILSAVFSLIPYFGNIIGFFLALTFGYIISGDLWVLIGIIATFTIAQFVESYILEPYIVGEKVDLHPFFVILAVIIGGAVWGTAGMILAIPILAILTVIFLNVKPLHPYGFLFSNKPTASER